MDPKSNATSLQIENHTPLSPCDFHENYQARLLLGACAIFFPEDA